MTFARTEPYTADAVAAQAVARGGDREVFRLGRWMWDVSAAKLITGGRVDTRIDPTRYAPAAAALARINRSHLADVDLDLPVIMIVFAQRLMPIDGWHRIVRAGETDVAGLPASVLTAAEADRTLLRV